ncbi:hypothetical protein T10_4175 [Trichinella papuae]|uniref:MULE transposase domain-containing protein n=1 Tax=Trichinella papuae TaxID=268474 RepID=A0A0V1M1W2_9BILA|nr:hypothetical protein T10_4175 [Trichinella papuae]
MLDMRIEVNRTSEHAEGCRVDAHAFYHQQQLNELKRLAAEDPRPVTQIYHELASSASTSLNTAGNFPTWDQARHIMYYSRARRFPPLPETRQELQPTAEQRAANSGEQAGVRLLAQSNCWCGDETFKILLRPAEELGVPLDLATFVCDFETALISAIQGNFRNIRVQGCFFHFFQVVLQQVGRLGLKTDYIRNQEVRKKVKMLMTLAFLPVNLVPASFEILNVGTSVKLRPCSSISSGSGFRPLNAAAVRINNHLEGWHSRMNKRARKHHLGFFPFLRLIIDAQGKTETVVQQMNAGYWLIRRGFVRSSAAYGVRQRRKNIFFLEEDIGTYGFIFQALLNKAAVLRVNLNPQTIICDFETALIPAIQGYFLNTRVQGCYFHFCQAVLRKVGEMGLKTRYRHDEETRRKIKMLLATAFLPVPQVHIRVLACLKQALRVIY